jgi:DNA (cytosine-5)-methyltransferase 1
MTITDLFCGAGGTSTGAIEAMQALGHEAKLTAINHWQVAVSTHTANHPNARHFCTGIDDINPRELFADGELDVLWASPECTHHSVARGGKPINDQSRATAWCVTRWAEALRPSVILVENVPEFLTWGAIGADGRPLKSKKGATFRAWVAVLESLGYRVDWQILCAADYGDPTTRKRLFVQAVRGKRRITWPNATHSKTGEAELFSTRRPWKTARDIIDWSNPGASIYERKRPLAPKTMQRIFAGLEKFGLAPHLVTMEHGGRLRGIDRPMPTVTTAKGGAIGVTTPYLVQVAHGNGSDVNADTRRSKSLDHPLATVCGNRGEWAICEPQLLPQQSGGVLRSINEPAPTVATSGAIALVEPFLIQYYGTGGADGVDEPLATVTTKERHALVRPQVVINGDRYEIDIRFRMLQPGELAAAQGFRPEYAFSGTKTDQVKQIGNAVPRRLARAIVAAVLSQNADVSWLADAEAAEVAA